MMKKVQFLLFFLLLFFLAGAQQKIDSQEYDFTRFFSADYRHYLKSSRLNFHHHTGAPVIFAVRYSENLFSSSDNPPGSSRFYSNNYEVQKPHPSGLWQSDILGSIIKSVIQEKRLQQ